MRVTLMIEIETEDDLGWSTSEDVRSSIEEVIEDSIPSGLHATVTVFDDSDDADDDE